MEWAGRPYESEEVRKFAAKMRNGIPHWFTFLVVPGVEPTNNRAERALREHVVQRKIHGLLQERQGHRDLRDGDDRAGMHVKFYMYSTVII